MKTKTVAVPTHENQFFFFATIIVAAGAALNLILSMSGRFYFGFTGVVGLLAQIVAAVLLFLAYMGKLPLFAAYIPFAVMGFFGLFNTFFLYLLFLAGAVVAILAVQGLFNISLQLPLPTRASGGCLLAAALFLASILIRFINMIVWLVRGVGFFPSLLSFLVFTAVAGGAAFSLFATELTTVTTASPQGGYAPPQGGYAPPQGGYAPPQGGYAPPQGGYAPPQGGYAQPQAAPGYTAPQSGPAPGYTAPQGGYAPPPAPPGYQLVSSQVVTTQPAAPQPTANMNAAAEIGRFKQLLDAGAITPEEFEAKKKSLLGL